MRINTTTDPTLDYEDKRKPLESNQAISGGSIPLFLFGLYCHLLTPVWQILFHSWNLPSEGMSFRMRLIGPIGVGFTDSTDIRFYQNSTAR